MFWISNLCYYFYFINTLENKIQLNRGLNLIFFSYTPTPTIGKLVKLYDATQTTTFGHINMLKRSIIYFCLWQNILFELGFKHTVKLATPNWATFPRLLSEKSHWLTKVSKSLLILNAFSGLHFKIMDWKKKCATAWNSIFKL